MAVGLFLALFYVTRSFQRGDLTLLVAIYFILLKLALVVALALMFSCATTPLLSILYTAGLYVAGLFVLQMRTLDTKLVNPAAAQFMKWLSYLLPNFQNFDVLAAAAHDRAIPHTLVLQNTIYTILYCAIVLTAAALIFSRRNLK
jgi:ABC-type transport system involved in multi-copper enzyme maturation permease subunit